MTGPDGAVLAADQDSADQDDSATGRLVLTSRERQVLERAADGMSLEQIAQDLLVSRSTVAYHLSKLYRQANVRSRHQLTLLWRRHPELFGMPPAAT